MMMKVRLESAGAVQKSDGERKGNVGELVVLVMMEGQGLRALMFVCL